MPSQSLERKFRRSQNSLYKSLADGDVDHVRLRTLLVERVRRIGLWCSRSMPRPGTDHDAEFSSEQASTTRPPSTPPDNPFVAGPLSVDRPAELGV